MRIENSSFIKEDTMDGISLPPGFSPVIMVSRYFELQMARPYSSCEIDNESPGHFDSELYNLIYYSPIVYTQQFCLNQCEYYFFGTFLETDELLF